MRAFNQTRKILRLLLATILCTTIIPFRSLADDKETTNPRARPAPTKPDSPAPLTERERWMLDRMEQLEKRVAELEAKGNPPAPAAAEVSTTQPSSPTSVITSAQPSGANVASAPLAATTNAISKNLLAASIGPQATEEGKSGA